MHNHCPAYHHPCENSSNAYLLCTLADLTVYTLQSFFHTDFSHALLIACHTGTMPCCTCLLPQTTIRLHDFFSICLNIPTFFSRYKCLNAEYLLQGSQSLNNSLRVIPLSVSIKRQDIELFMIRFKIQNNETSYNFVYQEVTVSLHCVSIE